MPDPTKHAHDFIDPKVLARLGGLGLHARLPMLGHGNQPLGHRYIQL